MFTHHSHSNYISHANDSLNLMIETYYNKGFELVCLTEHMPRLNNRFLYPEELEKSYTVDNLHQDFERYLRHAKELQKKYDGKMRIVIGFEVEAIDHEHMKFARTIAPKFEMMVGSIHFVNDIPIDFDKQLWNKAKNHYGSQRILFKEYFKLQQELITQLQPNVIGHFDLIRLFQDEDINDLQDWPEVWQIILENIQFAISYGALFELNSSAIRKGWSTPYPQKDIALAIKSLGGKFCLSDDAHSIKQIGLNYDKVYNYIDDLELDVRTI